jgi:Fe-S-cluster containining protein
MGEAKKEDRCSGGCCKEFYLTRSLNELKREYGRFLEGHPAMDDIDIIYPMLIDRDELGDSDGQPIVQHNLHRYECRNLLPNGDCGIYEKRPHMCRSFPNDKPCPNADCSWSLGRTGMWPGMTPLKTNGEIQW